MPDESVVYHNFFDNQSIYGSVHEQYFDFLRFNKFGQHRGFLSYVGSVVQLL